MERHPLNTEAPIAQEEDVNDVALEPEVKKDKRKNDVKTILNNFVENSTIAAIAVVHLRINLFWKILWFLIVILGFSVCLYQSVELIKNYYKYPSYMMQNEKINRSLKFPAVTVCSKNMINWKKAMNSDLSNFIDLANEELKENYSSPFLRRMVTEYFTIKVIIDTENKSSIDDFLYHPNDWFKGCLIQKFGKVYNCSQIHKDFIAHVNIPYYGTCVTVNPAFPNSYQFFADGQTNMMLVMLTANLDDYSYLADLNGIDAILHEPGSAPVIPFNKQLTILPSNWLQTLITLRDMNRLPHPYASNCTSQDSPIARKLQKESPYLQSVQPNAYIYSRQECMATCFQYELVKKSDCFHPYIPVDDFIQDITTQLCPPTIIQPVNTEDLDRLCSKECQKSCHELMYEWIPVVQEIPEDDNYLNDLLDFLSLDRLNTHVDQGIRDMPTFMSLEFESTSFIRNEEIPKIEMEDIFGSLGGNLALWVGLSILSLCELLELAVQLIFYCCITMHLFSEVRHCLSKNAEADTAKKDRGQKSRGTYQPAAV